MSTSEATLIPNSFFDAGNFPEPWQINVVKEKA